MRSQESIRIKIIRHVNAALLRCADSVDLTQRIGAKSAEAGSIMLDRISRSKGSIRFEINRQINATTRQTPSADAVDQQNKVIKAKSIEKQTFTARNEQKVILCQASLWVMNPCYQFPVSVERERVVRDRPVVTKVTSGLSLTGYSHNAIVNNASNA